MQAEEEVILIRGKRSKRPRPGSPPPLTMVTTSSTTAEFSGGGGSGGGVISDVSGNSNRANLNPSPSNSGHELNQGRDEEEEDMAHCLILLAKGQIQKQPQAVAVAANQAAGAATAKGEVYQCKTCNKSFPSFQALGGHRASHKKPLLKLKAVALEAEKKPLRESTINLSLQITSRTRRVHQCSICGAEFASGQALGGHMRRHRPMPMPTSSHGDYQEDKRPRTLLPLDLNLPAPAPAPELDDHDQRESHFPFAPNKQILVFSSSPLINCHY